MNRLTRSFVVGAAALVASVGVASQASAVPLLDFAMDGVHGPTAVVSYGGGATPLVGVDLSVDSVAGVGGTPLNNGTSLVITGGLLQFSSGANLGGYNWGANPSACTSLADPGCSIVVTGGVAALGIPNGTVLMAGRLTGAMISGAPFPGVILATFVNFVNATLAANWGLPGGLTPWASADTLNLSLSAFGTRTGAFRCA